MPVPEILAFRLLVLVAGVIQGVDLLVRSRRQWDDFSLTEDFAVFHQAWWLIGHGHLNPFDTIAGRPFWRDEFAIGLWPFGLLWPVSHSSFTLLVVQDLFIAAGTVVAGLWICDAVRDRIPTAHVPAVLVVVGAAAGLAIDPWAFETAAFDFHLSAVAAFFLLLCGRALWHGRRRSPFLWGLLAMTTGTAAAGLVIGLGLAALVTLPRRRRTGGVLALIGVVFLGAIVLLGANRGSTLDVSYGYLACGGSVPNDFGGVMSIAWGAILHPSAPLHLLWSRRVDVAAIFQAGGVLGLATGWGLGIALVNVLESGINAFGGFSGQISGGFQNYPVVLFVLVGTGLGIAWLVRWSASGRHRLVRGIGTGVLGFLAFASVISFAYAKDGAIQGQWVLVWSGGVTMLSEVETSVPGGWEMVVSQGLIGRFADRPDIYSYPPASGSYPLRTAHTVFVLAPSVGIETAPASTTGAAIETLLHRYHGQVLSSVDNEAIIEIQVDRAKVPSGKVELPAH